MIGRNEMKKYMCLLCGYIYDETLGWPEDGIAPGTPWEQVPQDWLCPECGAGKADFVMVLV
jgi:rubredoxin